MVDPHMVERRLLEEDTEVLGTAGKMNPSE